MARPVVWRCYFIIDDMLFSVDEFNISNRYIQVLDIGI